MAKRRGPQHYVDVIAGLLETSEPVSFYDAQTLIRQLRVQEDPPDLIIAALMQLHDADNTTDGAREVLADYLRGCAARQENQRLLAQRPITLRDSGKTARVLLGDRLELHLDEQRSAGYRWEVTARRGGVQVARSTRSHDFASTSVFDVSCARTGSLEVELEEKPPPAAQTDEASMPRRFALTVVVLPK